MTEREREREREKERERERMTQHAYALFNGQGKLRIAPLFQAGLYITQFLNTMYNLQLCVGDEFPFPLAKPSRSFQNLNKKSALIALFLSKSRKNGHKKLKID